eukprot:scaffold8286_cov35-Tisochrysis_lutea.AAC.1
MLPCILDLEAPRAELPPLMDPTTGPLVTTAIAMDVLVTRWEDVLDWTVVAVAMAAKHAKSSSVAFVGSASPRVQNGTPQLG